MIRRCDSCGVRLPMNCRRLCGRCVWLVAATYDMKPKPAVLAVVKVDATAPVAGHRLRPAVFQ